MKRLTATLALLAFTSAQLWAWGPKGHAIVADIAASHLSPAARKNIQLLIGNDSLASISTWADEVRRDRDESYNWHFVSPQDRHKNALTDHHNCVVDRIEMFQKVLSDETAPRAERVEALKWIVHFVADVHQPLHAIAEARGGNDIKVVAFGSEQCGNYACNLHWTWDEVLLQHAGYSEEDYVRHLEKLIAEKNLTAQAGGTPEQWANESHREAQQIVQQKAASIDEQYYQTNIALVDERLALAGLRLAALLNDALGGERR